MLSSLGAKLGVTYAKAKAGPHVRPIAEVLGATLIEPLDVEEPGGRLESLFEQVRRR